jgi:5-methyltetrahydrofolate--homocysteine methyltransferase
MNMALSQKLYDAIVAGNAKVAEAAVREEIAAGAAPATLLADTMIPAMDEVGKLFEEEEYFVPELLLAGRAMRAAMEPLRPLLTATGAKPSGVVIVGTVQGDLHDIGKNLVASMLEGGGFEVHDLGADVSPDKFIAAIRQYEPQIVCLSALLTVTMPAMKTTIDAITGAGVRDKVKVLIGGAPVTEQYARAIGADGYGATANDAVALSRRLIEQAG